MGVGGQKTLGFESGEGREGSTSELREEEEVSSWDDSILDCSRRVQKERIV